MLKFFFLLVVPLTVCEAAVVWIGGDKPDNFDADSSLRFSHNPTMKVFCENKQSLSDRVIHCFNFGTPFSFVEQLDGGQTRTWTGQAGAIMYRMSKCSYENKEETVEMAYLLLESCDDDSFKVNVKADGTKFEAQLPALQEWMRCKVYAKTECQESPVKELPETRWTSLQRPPQVASRSITTSVTTPNVTPKTPNTTPAKQVTPKTSPFAKPGVSIAQVSYCERGAYSCLACSVGRVCVPSSAGTHYEISRFSCTELHPYCNFTAGVCSDSPDPACFNPPDGAVASNFICMRDGFYPDITSCNKYYICKNRIPYEHKCPDHPTPYYHPRLKVCVQSGDFCASKTSAPACKKTANLGRKVPVLFTRDYFMYCGTIEVLAVDRCIGKYFYDPDAMVCRFVCPYQGLFMSMEHCTKYIKCTPRPQGGFRREDLICPEGKAFLESEYACVDRSRVPHCSDSEHPVHPDTYSK